MDHVTALKERAGIHFRCGSFREALALCKMALTLAPGDREAGQMLEEVVDALRLARAANDSGHPDDRRALPALERFLDAIHAHREQGSD